jgi:hypothetical protein
MTPTGVAYAGTADSDKCLGTLQPNDLDKTVAAVLRTYAGIHYATLGDSTAVVAGDDLEAGTNGRVVKRVSGAKIGVAIGGCSTENAYFQVVYTDPDSSGGAYPIVAAGIYTWNGGAATTASISVAGLLVTDVVIATLAARASTETLVLVANDGGNDQIDLTLSANGTNGTTKIHYVVLRPAA